MAAFLTLTAKERGDLALAGQVLFRPVIDAAVDQAVSFLRRVLAQSWARVPGPCSGLALTDDHHRRSPTHVRIA